MVSINYAFREISCKIVYYGPGLSGKTTNLQYVHQKVPGKTKGELISLATDADRTLYFDFLPINLGAIQGFATKFQLYTVPGQVYYNATRKLVLRGVDGLVFVADSQRAKMDENLESLKNLYDNLEEYGYDSDDLPLVIQYNKRDLPDVMSVEEMQAALNPHGLSYFEASAVNGTGVFDTLKMIIKLVLDNARRGSEIQTPSAGAAKGPDSAPAPAVSSAAPTPVVTSAAPAQTAAPFASAPAVTSDAPAQAAAPFASAPAVTSDAPPVPASAPQREPIPAVAEGAPAVEPFESPVVAPAPVDTVATAPPTPVVAPAPADTVETAPPTPVTAMASAGTIQQSTVPAAPAVAEIPAPAVPIHTTDPASHDPQAIALPSSAETEPQAAEAVSPDQSQVAASPVPTDTTPSVIPAAPSLKKQPERKKKRGFWRKLFSWK